jgi:hypothetical protein
MKLIIVLLFSLILVECVFDENNRIENLLEKTVVEFHQKMNEERFYEIYEQADEKFKSEISQESFVAQLRQIQTQFYPLPDKAYVLINDELIDGAKRTLAFKREIFSTFSFISNENEATTERFEWLVKDNQAKLISYKIDQICKKPCGIGIRQ